MVLTRFQLLVLIVLGLAILAMMATGTYGLLQPASEGPLETLPIATVPPNPLLLTRAPRCADAVEPALASQGWPATVTLDPQSGRLEVQMEVPSETNPTDIPAGAIWGALEAIAAGRHQSCDSYATVVIQVGRYRAEVSADDLLAWAAGEIDDGTLSSRVLLTH